MKTERESRPITGPVQSCDTEGYGLRLALECQRRRDICARKFEPGDFTDVGEALRHELGNLRFERVHAERATPSR